MRNMSFALTKSAVMAHTKLVTRRAGWCDLRVGDRVRAVEKAMGLKKGERIKPLAVIQVISVRREPARELLRERNACLREGLPHLSKGELLALVCRACHCKPHDLITRIGFRYVPEAPDAKP